MCCRFYQTTMLVGPIGKNRGDADLEKNFLQTRQPLPRPRLPARCREFQPIIRRPDCPQHHYADDRQLHIKIRQIGQQYNCADDRRDNQQSAHRRRSLFPFGQFIDIRLIEIRIVGNLLPAQPPNHRRPEDQTYQK